MCMYSERTQVLLSLSQRRRLERIAVEKGMSIGAVVREAIDQYTVPRTRPVRDAMEVMFALEAPTADWEAMKAEILQGATG
jgi:hypothetical protein